MKGGRWELATTRSARVEAIEWTGMASPRELYGQMGGGIKLSEFVRAKVSFCIEMVWSSST